MFRFGIGDVLVTTLNLNVTPVYDVVEESAGFVRCKEFLLADRIFQLSIIKLPREGTDYLFDAVDFLN